MKRKWAIAVVDAAQLRDWKLKKISSDETTELEWNYLLKIRSITIARGARTDIVFTPTYACPITKKQAKYKLSSASVWKTERGALNIINTINSHEGLLKHITKRFTSAVSLHLVDITDHWTNTINSQIEHEKVSHNKILQKLYNKLK